MISVTSTAHAIPHIGPAPPTPAPAEPVRVVEETSQSKARTDPDLLYSSSKAVLRLLKNSADSFREILELSDNVMTAGSMTGFRVPPEAGRVIDTYA